MLVPPVLEQSRSGVTERVGGIEVELPNGARLLIDAFVNEKAPARVFRAIKSVL